jgi:NAD(P) transhydrogenase subunit alpha
MSTALVTDLTIFVLALLVGIEVIGKVPATLHTPLMSAANSIHGIVLAGALLIGLTAHNVVGYVLAFVAAFFAAANVVGGYAVTGRMLKMFRRKAAPAPAAPAAPAPAAPAPAAPAAPAPAASAAGAQAAVASPAASSNGHGASSQAQPGARS